MKKQCTLTTVVLAALAVTAGHADIKRIEVKKSTPQLKVTVEPNRDGLVKVAIFRPTDLIKHEFQATLLRVGGPKASDGEFVFQGFIRRSEDPEVHVYCFELKRELVECAVLRYQEYGGDSESVHYMITLKNFLPKHDASK